jgi:hypothetical protein
MSEILLIDTNTTPFNEAFPVYPIGLDYLQGALEAAGLGRASILDLTRAGGPVGEGGWAERQARSLALIEQALGSRSWDIIGLSLRNIDSTYPVLEGDPGLHHYLPQLTAYLDLVQERADPRTQVVLGGTAFSMMPDYFLEKRPENWQGLTGPAEASFGELARTILNGGSASGPAVEVEPVLGGLQNVELLGRYLDRPISESTFGLRTKLGCGQHCGYCPYPLINGPRQRLKDPEQVVAELRLLKSVHDAHPSAQPWRFMFADDIFNRPLLHAKAVLRAMVEPGLIPFSWHAYLDPGQIDAGFLDLAAGTNGWCRHEQPDGTGRRAMFFPFDIESGSDRMLRALGKPFTRDDLFQAVDVFKKASAGWLERGEMDYAGFGLHLLVGYPGEDEESITETCDFINQTRPQEVAVQLGVRVYPRTPLARLTRGALWQEEADLYGPTSVPLDEGAVLTWLRRHLDEGYDRLSRKGNMLVIGRGDD